MIENTLPLRAKILERRQETAQIYTWVLQLCKPTLASQYRFLPGQFNMLYLPFAGEVPISIASDPEEPTLLGHTIHDVGRVTHGMAQLPVGAEIGLRGPFGRGWPLAAAEGHDLVLITGGLGCAPVLSVIDYVQKRRERFGKLTIVQKVKHADAMIWSERYEAWSQIPDTQVLVAATAAEPNWQWFVGKRLSILQQAEIASDAWAFLCGPEGMMGNAVQQLLQRGLAAENIHLSLERNMQCGHGLCGHCQIGAKFVCQDGPVFALPEIAPLFGVRGF